MNWKVSIASTMLIVVIGCGHGGSLTPQPGGNFNAIPAVNAAAIKPAEDSSPHSSFEWGASVREGMHFVRRGVAGAMEVHVQVRMRDGGGLLRYAQASSDPHSAEYRHFLTAQEIGDRFGASEADYKYVAKYFSDFHMRVGMWPQREILTVTGTFAQLKQAFGTDFAYFTYGGQMVIAPLQTPHFTHQLPVTSVQNLSTYNPRRDYYVRGSYSNFVGYPPQMFASGFDYSAAYSRHLSGNGIALGINGTWAISPSDVPAYGKLWHSPMGTVTQVVASPQPPSNINGGTGTKSRDPFPAGLSSPPPITRPCNLPLFPTPPNYGICNPEDSEAQLDTEQVASLAYGASILFYIAYNPSICINPRTGGSVNNKANGSCPRGSESYPLMGLAVADDSLQQAIADNRSDAQSLSWGEPENFALAIGYISTDANRPGVGQVEFASLSAEGIAVFVSSGDNGAWECYDPYTGEPLGIACPSYPASDPNVVAVGGVNTPMSESGQIDGQITAWGDSTTRGGDGNFQNNVGSGGGVSRVFDAPKWQAESVHNAKREIPDISMDGDPKTGASVLVNAAFGRSVYALGGTSVAAPQASAEWGLVLQACAQTASCATAGGAKSYRLGNPAPLYYALYHTNSYARTFYDILYGNNQPVPTPTATPSQGQTPAPLPTPIGYSAGVGYDMITGLGVPFVGHLIDAIINRASSSATR